jgi:hypothetical protein
MRTSSDSSAVEVTPIFGNLGALVNGNMIMGLFGSGIGIKLPRDERARLNPTLILSLIAAITLSVDAVRVARDSNSAEPDDRRGGAPAELTACAIGPC